MKLLVKSLPNGHKVLAIQDFEIPNEVWDNCCKGTKRLAELKADYIDLFHFTFAKYFGNLFASQVDLDKTFGFHEFFALEFDLFLQYLQKASGLKHLLYARKLNKLREDIKKQTWLHLLFKPRPQAKSLFDFDGLAKLAFPPKPFQIEGLKHFVFIKTRTPFRGIILAFDQGLGKTFTAIMIYSVIRDPKLALIVCPNSLKLNWKAEILKFRPDIKDNEIFVLGVDKKFRPGQHKIVIANYESLHKVLSLELPQNVRKVLIVDETQYARNVDTVRVSHLRRLVETFDIGNVLLLSGTPIKGHLDEFAPYFSLVDPYLDDYALKVFKDFYRRKKADEIFVARVRLYMIRFLKEQVLAEELPEKIERAIDCKIPLKVARENLITLPALKIAFLETYKKLAEEMKPTWCKIRYNFLRAYAPVLIKVLKSKGNTEAAEALQNIILLYKECLPNAYANLKRCQYQTIYGDKNCLYKLKAYKTQFAKSLLENNVLKWTKKKLYEFLVLITFVFAPEFKYIGLAIGRLLSKAIYNLATLVPKVCDKVLCELIKKSTKTLIFTKSAKAAKDIAETLQSKCNLQGIYITGETEDRFDLVTKFKEDPKLKFLVATYQTLGVGFTITEADTVIVWDLPWREADLRQAIDRIYRIGQDKPVKIYYVRIVTDEPTLQDRTFKILQKYREIQWQEELERPTEYNKKQTSQKDVRSLLKALNISVNELKLG